MPAGLTDPSGPGGGANQGGAGLGGAGQGRARVWAWPLAQPSPGMELRPSSVKTPEEALVEYPNRSSEAGLTVFSFRGDGDQSVDFSSRLVLPLVGVEQTQSLWFKK